MSGELESPILDSSKDTLGNPSICALRPMYGHDRILLYRVQIGTSVLHIRSIIILPRSFDCLDSTMSCDDDSNPSRSDVTRQETFLKDALDLGLIKSRSIASEWTSRNDVVKNGFEEGWHWVRFSTWLDTYVWWNIWFWVAQNVWVCMWSELVASDFKNSHQWV